MTFIEVLVVIVCLAVLVAMLLPILATSGNHPYRINCVSNLKQIGLAYRIWEGDNNNEYPMEISVTNGGAMELIATGDVAGCFLTMSNELSTPKILVCPEDWHRIAATNFGNDFNSSHISYFIGADVTNEINPKMLLIGDDNFEIDKSPVKSGLATISTNASITWGPGRHGDVPVHHFWTPTPHNFVGNLGFADDSVGEFSSSGLQDALQQTGLVTNRLAIP